MADLGVVDDLATMYEFDSLSAEFSIRDTLFDLGRRVVGKTFEKNDNFESSVEVEGEKYNKVAPSIGHAMTILGPVEFLRARYRPASRKGESFIPYRTSAWIDCRRPDTGRSQFIHGVPQQPDRS